MIILILAVIGAFAGFLLFIDDGIVDAIASGFLSLTIGAFVGVALCFFVAYFIPFEEEDYLAYTTEMTEFEPIGKDQDRIIYQYKDRDGVSVEFKPSSRVTMNYVNEGFMIETHKTRFTNKHVDYLLPNMFKRKHHIIYRKGE